MLTFYQSIRDVVAKGTALALVLMLAFSLMPARSASAAGFENEAVCTETGTIGKAGAYVRGVGTSTCPSAVPLHSMTVRFSVDFAVVDSGSVTCTNTSSCSHSLPWRAKTRGGHTYCTEVAVTYADGSLGYDVECEWLWAI